MLRLRNPRWLFGLVALFLFASVGLFCAIGLIAAFGAVSAPQAQILMWPTAIATILVGAGIGPRLRRREMNRRRDLIFRAGLAGLAAGLAWPLSFTVSIAAGEGANALVQGLQPVLTGSAIGFVSGALGGLAATVVATVKD